MASASFFTNSSLSLFPSSSDLLLAFPRLGFSIADFLGFGDGPWSNSTPGNDTSQVLATASELLNDTFTQEPGHPASSTSMGWLDSILWAIQRVGNFDGIFSYLVSKWASTTILVAIVLNRAHAFSSTRIPIEENWKSRLFLRIIPVVLLIQQALAILQTLRCQTGFHLPEIRYKGTEAALNKSWVSEPGLLHRIVSNVLFWQTTEESCIASGMVPAGDDSMAFHGSATVLWPLFLVLALSQLSETISSALRGQQPRPETGMSIFEHSMAFAEAETVARTSVGIGVFGLPPPPSATASAAEPVTTPTGTAGSSGLVHSFTRAMLLEKLNVPPEMLLVALISCCSHLSSQILAIAGLQHRFRLINTGVWGLSFLGLFFYSFVSFAWPSNIEDIHIARYPTVCIIGFIPHMVTFLGTIICAQVYVFAMASLLLSSPRQWKGLSVLEKVKLAHANMSASASWIKIKLSIEDDFYHFLLRIGYQIMMAAAEAVYFNEGLRVTLRPETWLERARYDEAIKAGRTRPSVIPLELHTEFAGGDGFGLVDEPPQLGPDGMPLPSGYAHQRKTMQHLSKSGAAAIKEEGVGISQRSGRWYMSWKLIEQIAELLGYCVARLLLGCWEAVRRQSEPPLWLLQAANVHAPGRPDKLDGRAQRQTLQFWRLTDSGAMQVVEDGAEVDVETETRRRFAFQDESTPDQVEQTRLDSHLYDWWKKGGWWGEVDASADYTPGGDDMDTTSIASGSTSAWETESMSSAASDATVVPRRVRAGSPFVAGDKQQRLDDLAKLLDPQSLEEKQEARLLAHRLRQDTLQTGAMTRSQYRRSVLQERLSVLPGSSQSRSPLLSPDDEALMLQHLIVTRRRTGSGWSDADEGRSWQQGGAGMGDGGPKCAVCQSVPRTILVWPCRCLSLCEECRVTLAESNFATCVCCRRDVVAFSRLYVP